MSGTNNIIASAGIGLKIAWRSLRKYKLYTFVNLASLTVGITSCILIGLYMGHELSYDRFHHNADRIVRATMAYGRSGHTEEAAVTGTKAGPEFKRSIPGVEDFTRTILYTLQVSYGSNTFNEKDFLYADSSFFRIFSFPLLQGDPATALNAPGKVVITKSMAEKYFGQASPMGRSIRINGTRDYLITGVAADAPGNSQIPFRFVASFSSLSASKNEEWFTANYITYLLLTDSDQRVKVQQNIASLMHTDRVRKEARLEGSDFLSYQLEPLTRVHLYARHDGLTSNGSITYVYILGAIALLILIIACVNYTNLATAQAESRKGEISVRKVLGAGRASLFRQFLGESVLLSFISLILGLGISILLLPLFNNIANKALTPQDVLGWPVLLALVLFGFIVSLLAGAYPAFILANQQLMGILRAGFAKASSGNGLRRGLIVFQFTVSVFLMIATLVVIRQLSFIRNHDLGYDKDHILILPAGKGIHADYEGAKLAFRQDPHVLAIGGAYENPTFVQWTDGLRTISEATPELTVKAIPADMDFVPAMDMKLIAGSNFDKTDMYKLDTSDGSRHMEYSFILNESAVRALGWTPENAIGKRVTRGNGNGRVKGVVRDFFYSSMHQKIGPLMIFLDTMFVQNLYLRISGQDIPRTLANLEAVWKQRVPDRPFEYQFLSEEFDSLYKTEARTGQLFGAFAITAILLACLGLFALAAFTTTRRTKEIGIRKVLGASVTDITAKLSGDFIRLVAIAALIAFPLSWWAMQTWLGEFAYRIAMPVWAFGAALGIALIIALATVSFQTIRAALANPVDSLRSE